MARKTRKIRHRLYIDKSAFDSAKLTDGICIKPKNMHWETFHRLRRAESKAEDRMNNAFMVRFGHWL
jgi:hypothetical protein